MNNVQKNYAVAKANFQLAEQEYTAIDEMYIKENQIANPDGSIPSASWAIEDDIEAVKVMDICAKIAEDTGVFDQYCKARILLREAEDALIKFGLDFLPKSQQKTKETLERAAVSNPVVRDKLIDLAFCVSAV